MPAGILPPGALGSFGVLCCMLCKARLALLLVRCASLVGLPEMRGV